jgi:hypothetical protein
MGAVMISRWEEEVAAVELAMISMPTDRMVDLEAVQLFSRHATSFSPVELYQMAFRE